MTLKEAVVDIRYLLDRGYPQKGVLGFVCDHYRFDENSRHLLSRLVLATSVSEKRNKKFLPCEEMKGKNIMVDGYNIIIGMESILEKKAFLCDDGVIRDIKGIFRNFTVSETTETSIGLLIQFLKENKVNNVCFLLDSQMSKSGELAKNLREKIRIAGLKGDARTSKHVDYDLKNSEDIVASSDGVIIDEAKSVVNLLRCVVGRFMELEEGVDSDLYEVIKSS